LSEEKHPPSEFRDFSEEPGSLVALLELREFIASELDPSGLEDRSQRTVRPLTNGLGLESPRRAEGTPARAATPTRKPTPLATPSIKLKPEWVDPPPISAPLADVPRPAFRAPEVERPLASVIAPTAPIAAIAVETPPAVSTEKSPTPPPMPKASLFRRLCAAIIDELFVWSLFLLALGVTLKVLAGPSFEFTLETLRKFPNPVLVRFGIMEFATLWLSYFAICVGVLDMTFGMWVWGLRITYGRENTENRFIRKVLRIVLSFFFYAPLLPLVLLGVQRKGRNLLDFFSGTTLYRSIR